MNLAILYVGACVLFITGRMGSPSLCVFMYAFNCGAVGLICNKNFCCFLSIIV